MKPNPKVKRVKLTAKQYNKLRHEIYVDQLEFCLRCEKWKELEHLAIHHLKTRGSGGGDDRNNCVLVCKKCHTEIHQGCHPK